jgi:hypothetical protein
MTTNELALIGGTFAVLTFWHFLADWTFQSHKEALTKATDANVRGWHCLKYAAAFMPLIAWVGDGVTFTWLTCFMSFTILFFTHYVIDSYVPVMLWAKYLRRAPQFNNVGKRFPLQGWQDKVIEERGYENDEETFKAFAATPLGLVLMITMDQFMHITCLLPIAYLMTLR